MRSAFSLALRSAACALALFIAPFFSIQSWSLVIDPDIWWHIRTGDWILANHALPRTAIFSQHIERQWIAYSWLFEVLVSTIQRHFGLQGLLTTLVILQIGLSLIFLLAIRQLAGSFWMSWLIGLPTIYAFYVNPLRSLIFSMLFFTLELLLIFESERKGNTRLLFLTAPLFLLWANFHIQFIYGLFILSLYLGARLVSPLTKKWFPGDSPVDSPMTLLGIFGLAVVGSCLGPNWAYPYKVVFDYAVHTGQYQVIMEMLAMNFRRPEHYVELALLMAACYALGRKGRRDLFRPALLLVTAMVSFRSLRDAWFVSIAAAFLLAEAAGKEHSSEVMEPQKPWSESRLGMALNYGFAAALALGASFALASRMGVNPQGMMSVIDQVYPVRATGFLRESNLPGPLYNSFNWGGFLIFNLREQPVSIDPRVNAYSDEMISQGVNTVNAIGWQQDGELARANIVLLERSAPLAAALANDPRYRLAYKDHNAVVFLRERAP